MQYIVVELQANNGSVSNIVTSHETKAEAESKYHLVLSAAAISNVPTHSAVMMRDDGTPVAWQSYSHGTQQQEE